MGLLIALIEGMLYGLMTALIYRDRAVNARAGRLGFWANFLFNIAMCGLALTPIAAMAGWTSISAWSGIVGAGTLLATAGCEMVIATQTTRHQSTSSQRLFDDPQWLLPALVMAIWVYYAFMSFGQFGYGASTLGALTFLALVVGASAALRKLERRPAPHTLRSRFPLSDPAKSRKVE